MAALWQWINYPPQLEVCRAEHLLILENGNALTFLSIALDGFSVFWSIALVTC